MLIVTLAGGIGSGKSTVAAALAECGARLLSLDDVARDVLAPGETAVREVGDLWPEAVREGKIDRAALARIVFDDAEALARLNAVVHPRTWERAQAQLAAWREESLRAESQRREPSGGPADFPRGGGRFSRDGTELSGGGIEFFDDRAELPGGDAGLSDAETESPGGDAEFPGGGEEFVVVVELALLAGSPYQDAYHGTIVVDAPEDVRVSRLVDSRGMDEADARARIASQTSASRVRELADVVVDNGGSLRELWEGWLVPYAANMREGRRVFGSDAPPSREQRARAAARLTRQGAFVNREAALGGGGASLSRKGAEAALGGGGASLSRKAAKAACSKSSARSMSPRLPTRDLSLVRVSRARRVRPAKTVVFPPMLGVMRRRAIPAMSRLDLVVAHWAIPAVSLPSLPPVRQGGLAFTFRPIPALRWRPL